MPTVFGFDGSPVCPRPDLLDRFRGDERAIEGLPIRLVIALVVGVASLGVMMNMLSGLHGLSTTELGAKPSPDVVSPGRQSVEIAVVDPDGNPVSGATVVVEGDTASLDGVQTATTGKDGTVELSVTPHLRANQQQGALAVEIKPPAGGSYADDRENTAILVVRDS